jgi:membrane associated rhomboid family serine protease
MGRKRMDFYVVTVVSAITAGLGAWFFGASGSVHLGASGVIFGYLGFLLARGIYERSAATIALSLFCGWIFGSMLWGVLPFLATGVSWQSHLFGFLGGILTARQLGLERRRAGLVR